MHVLYVLVLNLMFSHGCIIRHHPFFFFFFLSLWILMYVYVLCSVRSLNSRLYISLFPSFCRTWADLALVVVVLSIWPIISFIFVIYLFGWDKHWLWRQYRLASEVEVLVIATAGVSGFVWNVRIAYTDRWCFSWKT